MSLQLLMPVLQPQGVEAGLGAVLERLNPDGEVAHEEDIGEYAVLRRLRIGEAAKDSPIFDYKMIDDDFMLPVVAARYLLDTPGGQARAADFLARRTAAGEAYGAALVRNLRFVVSTAEAFAKDASRHNLISLKPGETVGNWRDSEDGLGGGRAFPAGLMTDVGPVVANPAYADDELEATFGRGRYRGTVIWSWQQAMLFAGMSRQLERSDVATG